MVFLARRSRVGNMALVGLMGVLFFSGCATSQKKGTIQGDLKRESPREITDSLQKVSGAVTKKGIRAKYCPICGRHYSPRVQRCPFDNSPLKVIKE